MAAVEPPVGHNYRFLTFEGGLQKRTLPIADIGMLGSIGTYPGKGANGVPLQQF